MIRRANIGDAEMLAELGRSSFSAAFAADPRNRPEDMRAYIDQSFAIDVLAAELANPAILYLVDQREELTVGYARLDPGSNEPCVTGRNPIQLSRLYGRAQHLGKGIGAGLLEACFAEARARGHDVLWLGVWEFNLRAQKFYDRFGFRRVGEHTFLLGSDPQIDWILQREV